MTTETGRDERRRVKAALATRAGAALAVAAVACFALVSASASPAATLQVCPSGCTYSQIASAVAAAQSGDTVTIAAGTYQGGFTINTSLTLAGAGAGTTIISGGGPVVTIGSGGSTKLNVSITGVTITGGVTHSSPESVALYGKAGVLAAGGGIEITPDNIKNTSSETPGATVTIADSVIAHNSVSPIAVVPSPSGATCPGGICKFSDAAGGGIYNAGTLTLTHTTVSDNSAGPTLAAETSGGGIENEMGSLTVINSTISGNEASVTAPYGRFAQSGAINVDKGDLAIRGSSLTHNRAIVTVSWPGNTVDTEGHGGAMHITAGNSATITSTKITGNSVSITNKLGSAYADSGGVKTDGTITLSGDVIANNHVNVVALGGPSANADGDSGAGEVGGGTISNSRLSDNAVTVRSEKGSAYASSGAGFMGPGSINNSLIRNNHVQAISPAGSATAVGGALQISGGATGPGPVTLRKTTVSDNTAEATGHSATAQGGGIFDVAIADGPPGGLLTLLNANVSHNTLSGSGKGTVQGGGIFTTFKLTSTKSVVTSNTPDQCSGKGC
jgi:hypothetical protein